MSAPTPQPSYIILGAGVFGVSTAYHLIRKYPTASITLIDRDAHEATTRVAASWDWNKVVRADYDDLVYCQLALEAQDIFKSDELWKPFFHETGIFWTCRSEYAGAVIANYETLKRKADLRAVGVEEARGLYGGLFEDADYGGVKEVLVNRTSGWAAAGDCLGAVTRECLRLGVRYVVGEVETLVFERGDCVGVRMGDGRVVKAGRVVVCTGAYTSKLLEVSAQRTGVRDLPAGERIMAGGITTGMVKLDDESYQRFKDMPVGVQGYNAETGTFTRSVTISSAADIEVRSIHRQSATYKRQRVEVVGPDNIQQHAGSITWSSYFHAATRTRLRSVERLEETQGRHSLCQSRLLRQARSNLEDGEASHLLVCVNLTTDDVNRP